MQNLTLNNWVGNESPQRVTAGPSTQTGAMIAEQAKNLNTEMAQSFSTTGVSVASLFNGEPDAYASPLKKRASDSHITENPRVFSSASQLPRSGLMQQPSPLFLPSEKSMSPADSLFDGELSPVLSTPVLPIQDEISIYSIDEGESTCGESEIVILDGPPPGFASSRRPKVMQPLKPAAVKERKRVAYVLVPPLARPKEDYRPMSSYGISSKKVTTSNKAASKGYMQNDLAATMNAAIQANDQDCDSSTIVSRPRKRKELAEPATRPLPSKKPRTKSLPLYEVIEIQSSPEVEVEKAPPPESSKPPVFVPSMSPSMPSQISTPRASAGAFDLPLGDESQANLVAEPILTTPSPPPSRRRRPPAKEHVDHIPLRLVGGKDNEPSSLLTIKLLLSTRHALPELWNWHDAAEYAERPVVQDFENKDKIRTLVTLCESEDEAEDEFSVHHWVPNPDCRKVKIEDVVQGWQRRYGDPIDIDDDSATMRPSSSIPPRIDLQEKLLEKKRKDAARRKSQVYSQSVRSDSVTATTPGRSQQRLADPTLAGLSDVTDILPGPIRTPSAKALGKRRAVVEEPSSHPSPTPCRLSNPPTTPRPGASSELSRHSALQTNLTLNELLNSTFGASSSFAPSTFQSDGPYRLPGSSDVLFASIISPSAYLSESPSQELLSLSPPIGSLLPQYPSTTDALAQMNEDGPLSATLYDYDQEFEAGSSILSASFRSSWQTDGEMDGIQFATVNPSLLEPSLLDPAKEPEAIHNQITGIDPAMLAGNINPLPRPTSPALSYTSESPSSPDIPLKKSKPNAQPAKKQKKPPPPSSHTTSPYISPIVLPSDPDDGSWHTGPSGTGKPIAARKVKRKTRLPTKWADNALQLLHEPTATAKSKSKSTKDIIESEPEAEIVEVVKHRAAKSTVSSGRKRPARVVWEKGESESFCHQCRRKTTYLKMSCKSCPKLYCNRCIHCRYNGMVFKKAFSGACPCCEGWCNCDVCCRKRGAEFVSAKLTAVPPPQPPPRRASSEPAPGSEPEHEPEPEPEPRPRPPRRLTPQPQLTAPPALGIDITNCTINPNEVAFFAPVYGLSGQRVATSFIDLGVTDPSHAYLQGPQHQPKPKQQIPRHVFMGKVQPSWGVPSDCTIRFLDNDSDPRVLLDKAKARGATVRLYVGKKSYLFPRPPPPVDPNEDKDHLGPIFDVASFPPNPFAPPPSAPLASLPVASAAAPPVPSEWPLPIASAAPQSVPSVALPPVPVSALPVVPSPPPISSPCPSSNTPAAPAVLSALPPPTILDSPEKDSGVAGVAAAAEPEPTKGCQPRGLSNMSDRAILNVWKRMRQRKREQQAKGLDPKPSVLQAAPQEGVGLAQLPPLQNAPPPSSTSLAP